MDVKTEQFFEAAKRELQNSYSRSFLQFFPLILSEMWEKSYESFPDPGAAHAYGKGIRAEAIARLPELLEEFEQRAVANGAKVFWARDRKEANEYIVKLARGHGVRFVTKGKSMVTEEMDLNEALEEDGIEVYETDLGEFITQLLDRPPFHIVGPAINVPVEEVRDIFLERGVLKEATTDPVELGFAARCFLRDKFHHLKMGITGVNFAVAETGTIINVENEGNIRFNKSSPQIQVSIMSLEKVVPTMQDAMHLLRVLCRSCTGQALGAYVSMDSGPKKEDEIDGPEELHIVILDNGRSKIFSDPRTREALRCIRCGGCLNFCPIYQKIGGYPYGWAYSGPMGQILNPLLLGFERTQDLLQACTLCQACKIICPAGIDHPQMLLYYRAMNVQKDPQLKGTGASFFENFFYRVFGLAGSRPRLWRIAFRIMRLLINRKEQNGIISQMGGPLCGWFECRDLHSLPRKTFRDRWRRLKTRS